MSIYAGPGRIGGVDKARAASLVSMSRAAIGVGDRYASCRCPVGLVMHEERGYSLVAAALQSGPLETTLAISQFRIFSALPSLPPAIGPRAGPRSQFGRGSVRDPQDGRLFFLSFVVAGKAVPDGVDG
ncbi:hypothetical protein C8Q77DRAFT_846088 [Trametes polyzona]|nr:hypothetical protein C8Q77DRAFT_846088 [Trametes polyzona]